MSADRNALQLHRADLDGRGVRAQQSTVAEIEGVVHRPRRVVGGDVERLEVVEVVLDLRAFRDAESRPAEDCLDSQARARHRMKAADRLSAARQRHVDCAAAELTLERDSVELRAPRIEGSRDAVLRLVDRGACALALIGRKASETLQQLRHGALAAENLHAHRIERGKIRARFDVSECARDQRLQVLHPTPRDRVTWRPVRPSPSPRSSQMRRCRAPRGRRAPFDRSRSRPPGYRR